MLAKQNLYVWLGDILNLAVILTIRNDCPWIRLSPQCQIVNPIPLVLSEDYERKSQDLDFRK